MTPDGISNRQYSLTAGALALLSALAIGFQSARPLIAQSSNNAVFTVAQAGEGKNAYSQNCAS